MVLWCNVGKGILWISGPLISQPGQAPLCREPPSQLCPGPWGATGNHVIVLAFPFLRFSFFFKGSVATFFFFFLRSMRCGIQTKDVMGIRARESFNEKRLDHFQSSSMVHRGTPELAERWVTHCGWHAVAVGSYLCSGLALMSWAIGGLFEQTKEKYQKANWSQGENE